jgi:hypothetical protein
MKSSALTRKKSREPSPDQVIPQTPRLRAACESCHGSKVKCLGGKPCARCITNRLDCVYLPAAKIGKPKGSRNKSTLERLRREENQRLEAEQAKISFQRRPLNIVDGGLSNYHHHGSSCATASTSSVVMDSNTTDTMPQWLYMDNSRNWSVDTEVPGGSFQLLSGSVSPGLWVYGGEQGTVDCQPSVMSRAPLETAVGVPPTILPATRLKETSDWEVDPTEWRYGFHSRHGPTSQHCG